MSRPDSTNLTTEERTSSNDDASGKGSDVDEPKASRGYQGYIRQNDGVTKIEALYAVYGKGWKLWMLWASIGLVAYVYSLQATTTQVYLQYATSTFRRHSLLGTVSVINMLVSAVGKPVYARVADMTSRPTALASGLFFYTIGYIVVASSRSVQDIAGGEVLYTIGNTGMSFAKSLIVADITSLRNRGLVQGLITSPFIPNGFVAGFITDGIGGLRGEGWRWGYGMFIIMTPILMAPAIVVLYWGQWRAKRLGALSLADPGYAQRKVLEENSPRPSWQAVVIGLFWQVDVIGLVLLAFGLGCFLVPFSLAANADGGYSNPSMIALLVVGILLMISTGLYEWKLAPYPIMPRRVANRALICACCIDAFYWLSYSNGIYFNSWVWVVTDWSDRDYTFWTNALNTSMCTTGVIAGLIMRYTRNYKWPTVFGLIVRSTGTALSLASTYNRNEALIIASPILVGLGAAFSTIGTMVGVQASVPHADLAIAAAVLSLITSIGGSIGGAIGASIWTEKLPAALARIDGLNATQAAAVYGDIQVARVTEPRGEIIQAYLDTAWYLELPALIIGLLPIAFGLATTNFYLGDTQNAIELNKKVVMLDAEQVTEERIKEKVLQAEALARAEVAGKANAAA